jgi:hypothetical protein
MLLLAVATMATALFAGAAVYVSAVEHPARVSCGPDVALRQFGPSYQRSAVMQASLALVGYKRLLDPTLDARIPESHASRVASGCNTSIA